MTKCWIVFLKRANANFFPKNQDDIYRHDAWMKELKFKRFVMLGVHI